MKSHWRFAETNRKLVTVRSECMTVAYAIMIERASCQEIVCCSIPPACGSWLNSWLKVCKRDAIMGKKFGANPYFHLCSVPTVQR